MIPQKSANISRTGIRKWAILSIVIGMIAITAVVVELASGNGGSAIPVPTDGKNTSGSGPVAEHTYGVRSGNIDPATIRVPKEVTVPATGVYIRVRYPGSFNGTYQANGEQHPVMSSGDQLFGIQNTSQTVSGTFRKTDMSAKQELVAEIWKNGRIVESNSTKLLFGDVKVTAKV